MYSAIVWTTTVKKYKLRASRMKDVEHQDDIEEKDKDYVEPSLKRMK